MLAGLSGNINMVVAPKPENGGQFDLFIVHA
jgi:hypothetical protein